MKNPYLSKHYSLSGTAPQKQNPLTGAMRAILSNPIGHFLLFGVLMILLGYFSANKMFDIPYSVQSSLASTFAFAIASVGYCLLLGYSGLASLGIGGFISIGCYAVYYIMAVSGLSFWIALVAALAVGIVIGLIVGFISLRIEGIYLVILTLGLSEILRRLFIALKDSINVGNWELFGLKITRSDTIYVVVTLLVLVMIITHNLINSPTGRAMLAMKNSTAASQAMGISLLKYRLLAFVICSIYSVLAGMMLMLTVRSAIASNGSGFYALITSLNILAAVIIGGYRSIWGAVFGTFVMYGMQSTLLSRIDFLQKNPEFITFIAGILVILVVMFYPAGLAQLALEAITAMKKWLKHWKEGIYGKDLG